MSNAEIAQAAGIDPSTVCKLSKLHSWRGVSVWLADAFARACGVDLLSPSYRRDKRLVTQGKMRFLKKASHSQRRMFSRMLRSFGESRRTNAGLERSNHSTAISGDVVA
jgi:hypothetical protein